MRLISCVVLGFAASAWLPGQTPNRAAGAAWLRHAASAHAVLQALNGSTAQLLPPLPPGVSDIHFAEFFAPIGDRGLEYSSKLRALAGREVRLSGYMIRDPNRPVGLFLLADRPLTIEAGGRCAPESIPPTAVHVVVPPGDARALPYRPGRIAVVGRLELQPRVEADGRNSTVRLILEPVRSGPSTVSSL